MSHGCLEKLQTWKLKSVVYPTDSFHFCRVDETEIAWKIIFQFFGHLSNMT